MRLLIKQRVFSWSDTYDVYDEEGNVRYFVRAEVFALGHQIHVYDAAHVEVGMIRQKLFNLLPVFEIETGGIKRGQIEKQFTLFQPKYDIDFNGWRVARYECRDDAKFRATKATKSKAKSRLCFRLSGTSPFTIRKARPSTTAVFPLLRYIVFH